MQEAVNKDTCGLGAFTNKGVTKESEAKEGVAKEGVNKEAITKEGVTKEGVTKEVVNKEILNKDGVIKEIVNKEVVIKEGVIKEVVTKESVAKEVVTKESDTQEGVAKEGVTNKGSKKEAMVNNEEWTDEELKNKPFKCQLCEMRFSKNLTLLQHMGKSHKEGKDDDPSHPCPYCDRTFLSLKDLEFKHLKRGRCRKRYQCQQCPGELMLSKRQLEGHNEKEHGTGKTPPDITVDGTSKGTERVKKATPCNTSKFSKKQIPGTRKGLSEKIPISLDLKKKRANLMEIVDGEWKCKVCGTTAGGRKVALARHVEIHMDGLRLSCTLCSFITKTTTSLYRHRRLKHNNGKPQLKNTASDDPVTTKCKKKVMLKKTPQSSTTFSEVSYSCLNNSNYLFFCHRILMTTTRITGRHARKIKGCRLTMA